MNHSETAEHRELKRRALIWAQAQGYRAAAAEVTLPNYRFRLDVGAYRPQRIRGALGKAAKLVWQPAIGLTAVFECKASRPDFRRDAASHAATLERLQMLHERKTRIETELCLHYPSIRNGDSLFQEYQTLDFERPGHERYQQTLTEIARLTSRLYAHTKFDRLVTWGAANLFYVVAEPGVLAAHELPPGWGLLLRTANGLCLTAKPLLHEVSEPERLSLLHRISLAATRAVNREHGVSFDDVQQGG
jgi:hypothetical protein